MLIVKLERKDSLDNHEESIISLSLNLGACGCTMCMHALHRKWLTICMAPQWEYWNSAMHGFQRKCHKFVDLTSQHSIVSLHRQKRERKWREREREKERERRVGEGERGWERMDRGVSECECSVLLTLAISSGSSISPVKTDPGSRASHLLHSAQYVYKGVMGWSAD